MKKKIMLALSLLCLVALLGVLASCGHEHSADSAWKNDETNHWNACSVEGEECDEKLNSAAHTFKAETTEATCTETGLKVETCTVCGYVKETVIAVVAHDYADATCTAPKTCNDCGATDGEPIAHTYADATCTEPKTCTVCGATDGEALGHTGGEATCTEPAFCDVCNQPYGEPAGHKGGTADCITKATCGICGDKYGDYGDHDWVDATCTAAKHCSICQAEQGIPADHTGGEATCTEAAICQFCNQPYGEPAGHKGGTATCTEAAVCTVCNESYGAPAGHKGGIASCTEGPICDVCKEPYGAPMHAESKNGLCTGCGAAFSTVGIDAVESITPSHEGGGSANGDKLFDGEKTTTGIYGSQDKEYFPTADGDYIEIVLKEETYLVEAIIWTCGNWTGAKIEFLDANGNVVFNNGGRNITYNGSTEAGDSTPISLALGGVNVKTIRLTAAGIKWGDGRTQKTSEIELFTNIPVEE